MKKKIDYRSITDKFRTEKEFYDALDYILELNGEMVNILNSNMDEKEQIKQCKYLNKEMSRINKLSREFVKEAKLKQ